MSPLYCFYWYFISRDKNSFLCKILGLSEKYIFTILIFLISLIFILNLK